MITTGGSEALLFTFMTLCDPGDQVIIPEPFYTNVSSFAHSAMVELVPVTSHLEDAFALPPIEDSEKAYRTLWQCFYQTIAIEARENPKCRLTHMPRRFWHNMTEFDLCTDQTPVSTEVTGEVPDAVREFE